jgi:DNA helicase-2/ATP-dependent DNA helicase PcrA
VLAARSGRRDQDLLAGCDPEQAEAITTRARPLCVLAGAGSGKTRVLTRRIAWRIFDGSAAAPHVLALTFTRKAAAELRGRLAGLGLPETVTAGTFHAIALAELRRLSAERREPAPAVLSSKARIVHAVLSEGRPSWPGRGRLSRTSDERHVIFELAAEIEWAKSRLVTPLGYEAAASRAGREPPMPTAHVAETFAAYERERQRRRMLDFEDLLIVCAAELGSDAEFAASARWRFRHLFVDEYQDVNAAQLELLRAWCGDGDDLCVVGDPDQAIYGWNGSDPEAILRFPSEFAGATVLRLGTNYRSTAEVLGVAAAVLDRADAAPAGGPVPGGPVPTLQGFEDDAAEAAAIAERARLVRRPGRLWSQIAVLTRTNAQLAPIRAALEKRAVPCRILGDGAFLKRPHVAQALGELQRAPGAGALAAIAEDLRSLGDSRAADEDEGADGPDLGRLGDLADLAFMVEEYLSADGVATGPGFQTFIEANLRGLEGSHGEDAVELMTFHRAKGLEWPVVFVAGLEDGYVPIAHAKDAAALAEERRLLYVACTRAEEELHCSWARARRFSPERSIAREPSPYVGAIERATRRLTNLSARSGSAAREALAASRQALAGGSPV